MNTITTKSPSKEDLLCYLVSTENTMKDTSALISSLIVDVFSEKYQSKNSDELLSYIVTNIHEVNTNLEHLKSFYHFI